MRAHRVVTSGVSAALVALVLSGCGSSPFLPTTVVTSPYVSRSSAVVDPISGIGNQRATVRVCSIGGGPISVHVSSPGADAGTVLTVRAISTSGDADATLIEQTVPRGSVTLDSNFESNRPMRPGECANVDFVGNRNFFDPGDPFHFTIIW